MVRAQHNYQLPLTCLITEERPASWRLITGATPMSLKQINVICD